MLSRHNLKNGFTLIELLIALLLGSLLLAMVIGLYVSNVSAGNKAVRLSRLRTDLQALVGIMENDIRRAGYGGVDFMVGSGQKKLVDSVNTNTQKCIVYAYNHNAASAVTSSHFMAFRYSPKTNSIQFGRAVDLLAVNCFKSGTWVNLTDPKFLKVTDLSFIESTSISPHARLRSVEIKVSAELYEQQSSYQLSTQVQIRNPEY